MGEKNLEPRGLDAVTVHNQGKTPMAPTDPLAHGNQPGAWLVTPYGVITVVRSNDTRGTRIAPGNCSAKVLRA
jgi:hypothetical protein